MNTIKNNYRYVLKDRFGTIDATPLNEKDFTIEYEIEDDGKYFYSKQFGGKITFNGVIFQRLRNIERSIYICTEQELQVYRICDAGIEEQIFVGNFRLSDGAWDLDNCQVELGFNKTSPDKCLAKNKTQKINLLQEINTRVEVNTNTPSGTLETKECFLNSPMPVENDYWCGTGDPYAQNWSQTSYRHWSPDAGFHNYIRNTWAREIIVLDCALPAPPEWVLVQDDCATLNTKKYAKKVTLFDCQTTSYIDDLEPETFDFTRDCKILGYEGNSAKIDNGMLLVDVINVFMSKLCQNALTVVSDFFQINPETASTTNYVTGLQSQVMNIVLFQKSDVKRANATGNASKAEFTFEKFIEMLNVMFNVYYAIDGSTFRLEHISFFNRNAGLDLTLPRYERFVNGFKKYTYKIESVPLSEIWQYKETNQGWIGDIDYQNDCAIGQNNTEKKYTLDEVTADVELCIRNPASDSNIVEDKGFVVVSTIFFDGQYYMITESESGTGFTPRLNNVFGFHKLVKNYHFHNRPLKTGKLNGVDVTFISTKPLKKGEKLIVPLCCGDVFDPNNTIKTPLGIGQVDKATFNLAAKTLELDLLYNVFENLTNNIPPFVTGKSLTTYQETPIIFDVDADDADGVVVGLAVTYAAGHGLVEILSPTQAKYTPSLGFVGYDFFHLQATDDWGEISNNAPFIVYVLPPNQPPYANDDFYFVFHGYAFTAYPSIFANDGDDVGFTLVSNAAVTAQGVAITIEPNGTFTYTPPTGFEGTDTFQYSIIDGGGLISTATVNLIVGYKNRPKAVDDNYNTMKNTTLTTDGSFSKPYLWANDNAPDGLPYTYTCTAETKTTAQGGNVTINTDGTFVYTPPTGFEGLDNFDYTVLNINGQDTGTAFLHVLPIIYVKLVKSKMRKTNILIECEIGGEPQMVSCGLDWEADYTLYFYSDAGGTIPFDVTGLSLTCNIREQDDKTGTAGNSTRVFYWETDVLSGIKTTILEGYLYDENICDCSGYTMQILRSLQISTGSYLII